MKTSDALLVGGTALVVGTFLLKGRAFTRLNFVSARVVKFYFDGTTPVLQIAVRAQNTSSISLQVNSLTANLYAGAGQTYVGNVSFFGPAIISGNNVSEIYLDVRLSPIDLVNQLIQVVQYKNFGMGLTVDGFANVGGTQIAFKIPFYAGL
jgi:hypothetical protein